MARLEGKANMLFYPTDLGVIETIRDEHLNFRCWSKKTVSVLDPCVGDGTALQALMSDTPARTVGIELEEHRATEARERLDTVYHGAFEYASIVGEPRFLFVNPPYDTVDGRRVELSWIEMVAPFLKRGVNAMFILPEILIVGKHSAELRMVMYRHGLVQSKIGNFGDNVFGALRFPDPAFETYSQYALFLSKGLAYQDSNLVNSIKIQGVVGDETEKLEIDLTGDRKFSVTGFEKPSSKTEVNSDVLSKLFGGNSGTVQVAPLQPLSDGNLGTVIAGGLFTGIEDVDANEIVRGATATKTEFTKETVDGIDVEVEKRVMFSTVSRLCTITGEVTIVRSDKNADEFGVAVEKVAKQVKNIVMNEQPAVFDPDKVDLELYKNIYAPHLFEGYEDELRPAQITASACIRKGWETRGNILLSGEQGVGKTSLSIATATIEAMKRKSDARKVIVMAPPKILRTWKDEIKTVARDYNPKIVEVKTIKDVQRAFSEDGLIFILVSYNMISRASGWMYAGKKNEKCFSCGKNFVLVDSNDEYIEPEDRLKTSRPAGFCDKCGIAQKTSIRRPGGSSKSYKAKSIEARLGLTLTEWQKGTAKKEKFDRLASSGKYPALRALTYKNWRAGQNGAAYSPLGKYISKHYAGNFLLIIDEAHNTKGADTNRGAVTSALIRAAKRTLLMTGTFYNGKASSIFHLLYRSQPSFRAQNAYNGEADFIDRYGLREKITKEKEVKGKYSYSGYTQKSVTVKEIPGIHPSMVADMLPYTVFLKQDDLDIDIPPNHQATLFVDAKKNVKFKVDNFLNTVKTVAVELQKEKKFSLMGQYNWLNKSAYDVYPIGDTITDDDGIDHVLKPINSNEITPKEEALLRLIKKHKEAGEPVMVYYIQMQRRSVLSRLQSLGKKYGLNIVGMSNTQGSDDRTKYLYDAIDSGADAVVLNPSLIKEGFTLVRFKAIVWYGVTHNSYLVSQANKRIHRFSQLAETYIYYLGFNETYQADVWTNIGQKMAAMATSVGDVKTGIAALLGTPETDVVNLVQSAIIKWERYESDISLDDLPPLTNVVSAEPVRKTFADWMLENKVVAPVGRRAKAVPEAQMSLQFL